MLPDTTVSLLLTSAAGLATVHTLIGIDHSLPFVAVGRARGWTLCRTLWVTALCGLVHVASSVAIGGIGIGLGVALDQLSWLESSRGRLAAWLMMGFGLAYAAWALWRGERSHAHSPRTTTWARFLIFAFGPCEALIPLMMVPAAEGAWLVLGAVVVVFGVCTIGAMLVAVALGYAGVGWAPIPYLQARADLVAGLAVAASGAGVLFLGL